MTTLLDEWPSRIHHGWRCTRPDDRRRVAEHELDDGRRVEYVRCDECDGSDLAWRLAQMLDDGRRTSTPPNDDPQTDRTSAVAFDRDCGRCHHPLDSRGHAIACLGEDPPFVLFGNRP